jgi:hypothetical protein
MDRQTDRWTNG